MITTGLSANELYCITQKRFKPSDMVFGNALHSLEAIKSLESSIKTSVGEELRQLSILIKEARHSAYQRMLNAITDNTFVVTHINTRLVLHPNHIEFLSEGYLLQKEKNNSTFTSAANGQELFALLDARYNPCSFVFGSITYSTKSHSLFSGFKNLAKGEVKTLSESFNSIRHKVLDQLIAQAKEKNAPAILGIKTIFTPFDTRACEMLMTGTAVIHPSLASQMEIATSHLSAIETWNLAKMGYIPIRLLLTSSVYSLGLSGQMSAPWRILSRSENTILSKIIYEARKKTLSDIKEKAQALHADDVIGVKIYINPLDYGLVEIFAIGTAIKKMPDIKTESDQLPAQVIVSEKNTFYSNINQNHPENAFFKSLTRIVVILLIIASLVWLKFHQP